MHTSMARACDTPTPHSLLSHCWPRPSLTLPHTFSFDKHSFPPSSNFHSPHETSVSTSKYALIFHNAVVISWSKSVVMITA